MAQWIKIPELGPIWGMQVLIWTCRMMGRPMARLLLKVVVFYYFLFARAARRASADYLRRLGLEPRASLIYSHMLHFAQTSLDRLYFVAGEIAPFEITCTGHEHLSEAAAAGTGAVVLGAHVGSFEAMRAVSDNVDLDLVAAGYFKNAQKINQLLDRYGANSARLVHIEPNSIGYMLQIKALLDQGTLVALLGDREWGPNSVEVTLFGDPVQLPVGPYALASQQGCPLLVTFGLFTEPNKYELFCENLGRIPSVGRKDRDRVFSEYAAQYAQLVEKYCRKYPLNWFNFYDYWKTGRHEQA